MAQMLNGVICFVVLMFLKWCRLLWRANFKVRKSLGLYIWFVGVNITWKSSSWSICKEFAACFHPSLHICLQAGALRVLSMAFLSYNGFIFISLGITGAWQGVTSEGTSTVRSMLSALDGVIQTPQGISPPGCLTEMKL